MLEVYCRESGAESCGARLMYMPESVFSTVARTAVHHPDTISLAYNCRRDELAKLRSLRAS